MSSRILRSPSSAISETPAPAAKARDRLGPRLGLGQPAEDVVGMAYDRLAGLGQADAARAALDEHGAGLALERRDLLRDGGLGERERLGGGRERAAQGDLPEHSHAAYVEHQRVLYQIQRTFICADGPGRRSCSYPPHSPGAPRCRTSIQQSSSVPPAGPTAARWRT